MVAGVATGILAGLFGIGGGAIIVPVLYEIFRILGVPEEVRMQLCVGTSMAIIIPTTIRSYLTHRAKGVVLNDVMREWAVPAVLGVAAGSVIAYFAPSAVFKIVFMVTVTIIAIKLLFGRDSWRIADDFPGRPAMIGYGFLIGITSSLMGVSGGSVSNMIQTLYGKPLHNAVATSAGLGVPITIAGTIGLALGGLAADGAAAAVLDRLRVAARRCPHGAGVELHRALRRAARPPAVEAPAGDRLRLLSAAGLGALRRQSILRSTWLLRANARAGNCAPPSASMIHYAMASGIWRALLRRFRLADAAGKCGTCALKLPPSSDATARSRPGNLVERGHLRLAAHHQLVAAHLPAFQPVEEAHAEQARSSWPGCAISAGTARSTMPPTARRSSVTGGGAGAAVRGIDLHRIGQQLERQAGGLGGLLREHDGARAGVEHHGDARAVDLRRHLEIAAAPAHDLHRRARCACAARPGISSAITRSPMSRSSPR